MRSNALGGLLPYGGQRSTVGRNTSSEYLSRFFSPFVQPRVRQEKEHKEKKIPDKWQVVMPDGENFVVDAFTKSEARAAAKDICNLDRFPVDGEIVKVA